MKKILLTSFLVLLLAALSAVWWLHEDMQRQLNSPMALDEDQVLVVEPGMSLRRIGRYLSDNGWLSHPWYFIYEARQRDVATRIHAGEYAVEQDTTPADLLERLIQGKVIQYSLTLPEGITFRQILMLIKQHEQLEKTLHEYTPESVMAAIDKPGMEPEGRFYPDTYHFPRDTTDVEFLRRAWHTMETILAGEWPARDTGLPYETPYEALIMASIIEKETAVPEERGRIAGVFVRRLQKGMKLQTDPTVIYALGRDFDGNIRRRDLGYDSPYNTYVYRGLPPTPIAAPGRDSIHAALHPEDGDELYFVSRGDGSHHFSSTLAEHNRAVRRYQLNGSNKPRATSH